MILAFIGLDTGAFDKPVMSSPFSFENLRTNGGERRAQGERISLSPLTLPLSIDPLHDPLHWRKSNGYPEEQQVPRARAEKIGGVLIGPAWRPGCPALQRYLPRFSKP
jgi:hypothetical protein